MATAAPSSLTTISALLKTHYQAASKIQNSMIDFGPLTAKLLGDADTSCDGDYTPFPLIYAGGGGFGSSMAAAFNTATPAGSVKFQMSRATVFGQVVLGGEALKASENPDGAFIADLALEIDVKRRRLHEYLACLIYGDGTGAMAQVSSFSAGVITLADPPTAAKFQVNDVVNLGISTAGAATASLTNWAGNGVCTTTGSGAAPTGTIGVAFVTAVDIPGGKITISASQGGTPLSTIATLWTGSTYNVPGAGSYLYFNGDAGIINASALAIPANTLGFGSALISGLMSWMVVGGPASSGDSFFGVNRYGNSSLYGQVIDATSAGLNLGTIRAALTNGIAQLRQVGSKPKECYMHPLAFYKLSLELQSQGMYPGAKGEGPSAEGSFGFSSLILPTEAGEIEVIADPFCMPALTNSSYLPGAGYSGAMMAFILDDNWEVISMGEVPELDETDGNYFLRIQGTDTYQIQEKAYCNLGTHRPNGSCAIFLPL